VGGPIIKNKMFLFGNYDGSRIRQGVFRTGVVPTAAQLGGNFTGYGKVIRDPQTTLPFPDNIIPRRGSTRFPRRSRNTTPRQQPESRAEFYRELLEH
jgi:hypothetical protein